MNEKQVNEKELIRDMAYAIKNLEVRIHSLQNQIDYLENEIDHIQSNCPEFKDDEEVEELWKQLSEGKQDDEDLLTEASAMIKSMLF